MKNRTPIKDRLPYSQDENGQPNGLHIDPPGWLMYDRRDFDELLSAWEKHVGGVEALLDSTALDNILSKDDVVELMTGHKTPSRELTNYLSSLVPEQITTWRVMRNHGYKAAKNSKNEQITLTREQLQKARLSMLHRIAEEDESQPSVHTEDPPMRDWLAGHIMVVASRYGKSVDIEQSMQHLAEALSLTPAQLCGHESIPRDRREETAQRLADLLNLEAGDYDKTLKLIEHTWDDATTERPAPRLTRALRFLRHTCGMTQEQLTAAMECKIKRYELGIIVLPENMAKLSDMFQLNQEERRIVSWLVDHQGTAPFPKQGESSWRDLHHKYVGTECEMYKKFRKLRERLVDDIVTTKIMTREDAEANVGQLLIGKRKVSLGQDAWHVTENGEQILQDTYKLKLRSESAPSVQEGEIPVKTLQKQYVGGNIAINKELTVLREKLIGDIIESTSMSYKNAAANVDAFFIGMRKPARGREGLYVTQGGLEMWEETYKRERSKPIPPSR
jgi:hypothetical protein